MKARALWISLPSNWVRMKDLCSLSAKGDKADNIMALMCLIVIAHEAEKMTGLARVTYDQFETALLKSRSLISRGLQVLFDTGRVTRGETRSEYQLADFDLGASKTNRRYAWAKFPCRSLYDGDAISMFKNFKLRSRIELDALKLMLLIAAFRDNDSNMAQISYDKICEYTGMQRESIKRALSLLAINGCVFAEVGPSKQSDYGISYSYRLPGIDPYNHGGTKGRESLF